MTTTRHSDIDPTTEIVYAIMRRTRSTGRTVYAACEESGQCFTSYIEQAELFATRDEAEAALIKARTWRGARSGQTFLVIEVR